MLYKRNFIFGFGFGLIFTSLIVFGVASFFYRDNTVISAESMQGSYEESIQGIAGREAQGVSEEISEEAIVAMAKSLGMDFVGLEATPGEVAEVEENINRLAEIEDDLQEGLSEAAEEGGNTLIEADGNISSDAEESSDATNASGRSNNATTDASERSTDSLVVFIPRGSSSLDIAEILEENNIINNRYDFNDFIVERGRATRLQWGEFSFDKNMTFDEILSCFM